MSLQFLPYYKSYNSSWVSEPSSNYPILSRSGEFSKPVITGLGYQGFYEHNSVKNPTSLGGLWFGRSRKSRRSKRSRKSRKSKRRIRRSRRMGTRQLTPGGMTTSENLGIWTN